MEENKKKLSLNTSICIDKYDTVFACCYDINNDGKYPFLRYLLTNKFNVSFNFPIILMSKNCNNLNKLVDLTKQILKLSNNCHFNGFYEYNNNLYLFFDVTKQFNNDNIDTCKSNFWLGLMDEIVNHHAICNMPINEHVADFFEANSFFCFLKDENDINYEIPFVGFTLKPENKLQFTHMFGETKSEYDDVQGHQYCFTDYFTCFEEHDGKTKSGIIRFSLFAGTMGCIDDDDVLNNFDRYDSIYKSNNKKIYLKEYDQQIPLSYHHITKNFQIQ